MSGDPGWIDLAEWKRGKVFYTADLHLGHERIIELCDRPYSSVSEMNAGLLEGINSKVGTRNSLVVLGDVLLGKFEESVQLLREIRAARVLLLPGNHDRWSLAYGHRGAVETVRTKRRLWRSEYEAANSRVWALEDQAPSAWEAEVAGRRVLLSHYPYAGASRDGSVGDREERYSELRARDVGAGGAGGVGGVRGLVCGHVHQQWRQLGRMLNVGVDVSGYAPVAEEEIGEWLARSARHQAGEKRGAGTRG